MTLSQYTAGKLRKSRTEKEQEAADAKGREEEANAAQAYAEFLVEFEGGEGIGQRAGASFVKAESKAAYTPSIQASERRPQPARVCQFLI
jgi:U2-associated protein SR140